MQAPSYDEVYQCFFEKLKDATVSESMARRFMSSGERNGWTVKQGKKKRVPMTSYKRAVTTWIRNMSKYSKKENIALKVKELFNEEN